MTRLGKVLANDVARYLAAVETFRAEGCEPNWRAELLIDNFETRHLQTKAIRTNQSAEDETQ